MKTKFEIISTELNAIADTLARATQQQKQIFLRERAEIVKYLNNIKLKATAVLQMLGDNAAQ